MARTGVRDPMRSEAACYAAGALTGGLSRTGCLASGRIMRKEYDFSSGRRGRHLPSRASESDEPLPLTPAQRRELRRRADEIDNPTRFLVVSGLGRRFQLYYNVEDDCYAMNDPRGGTLFKSRRTAAAVASTLGPDTRVARCRTWVRKGRRQVVLKSVPIVLGSLGRRLTRA